MKTKLGAAKAPFTTRLKSACGNMARELKEKFCLRLLLTAYAVFHPKTPATATKTKPAKAIKLTGQLRKA